MKDLKLLVTLWPSFDHFTQFASDPRLVGIRLNSAMITRDVLGGELSLLKTLSVANPLYFDIKGRQLRVEKVFPNPTHLDITLNHPIKVRTPIPVLFKAGADHAYLVRVEENGKRLIFAPGRSHGPFANVSPGESLHIRDSSLQMSDQIFTNAELDKIAQVRQFGFKRYFLSYVESQREVDQFLELVGKDCEIMLKIESKKGLEYVAREFVKRPNLTLVQARGDMYVEVDKPHDILAASRLIIERDPEACAGSRLLLSVMRGPVPECADFSELAWLYDIGYRSMMLCDEICLTADKLELAINVFESFREAYARDTVPVVTEPPLTTMEKLRNFFTRG